MRHHNIITTSLCFLLFSMMICSSGYGQFREYMVVGKIVGHDGLPIAKAVIFLEDTSSSRSYTLKTNKKGVFKFAGLPHATYKVSIKKEGYQSQNIEWKLDTPQHKMKKVDIPTIVLISDAELAKVKLGKKLQADYDKAKEKIARQQYDEALEILEKMIGEKSDDPAIYFLYGECLLQKEKYPEASDALLKVISLNPSFAGGYFKLGVSYQRQDMLEKALENYQKNLELEPANFACLYNTGMILYTMNRQADAIKYLEKALEIKPDDVPILEMTALCHINRENYSAAQKYLEKALGICKDEEKRASLQALLDEIKKQTT